MIEMRDVLMIGGAIVVLIAAFAVAGLVWWSVFLSIVGVSLAAVEYYLWRFKGTTLSKQFGDKLRERPVVGIVLLLLLSITMIGLILHLIAMRGN